MFVRKPVVHGRKIKKYLKKHRCMFTHPAASDFLDHLSADLTNPAPPLPPPLSPYSTPFLGLAPCHAAATNKPFKLDKTICHVSYAASAMCSMLCCVRSAVCCRVCSAATILSHKSTACRGRGQQGRTDSIPNSSN